jgi:hypothetical protein
MVHNGTQLSVEVDVRGAAWPLTVDPLLSTETTLTASDAVTGDAYGASVSGAADLNGDGFDDLLVVPSGTTPSAMMTCGP